MLTPRRSNPNIETAALFKKYLKAQRIRPLTEVDNTIERKGTAPRPTKYLLNMGNRAYVYFDDGSLRRGIKIKTGVMSRAKLVLTPRVGKKAAKQNKRRRMAAAGLITNKQFN